jgi:hypothetical protein
MVGADLARCATLVPVAVAGFSGGLPLWGLIAAAFALEAATSYFVAAYGATIPAVVERKNVQQANALVHATAHALSIGGWALAAALLTFLPVSTLFAVDAATFLVSALLIARLHAGTGRAAAEASPRLREGIAALRPRRALSLGVVVFAVAMTITTGSWIGGIPTFVPTPSTAGRRLLAGDDRLRRRRDRRRSSAGADPSPREGPREHARVADLPPRARADRGDGLAPAPRRRRGRHRCGRDDLVRAAQLGGTGKRFRTRCSGGRSASSRSSIAARTPPASCSWRHASPSPPHGRCSAPRLARRPAVGLEGALLATRLVQTALPERAEQT